MSISAMERDIHAGHEHTITDLTLEQCVKLTGWTPPIDSDADTRLRMGQARVSNLIARGELSLGDVAAVVESGGG